MTPQTKISNYFRTYRLPWLLYIYIPLGLILLLIRLVLSIEVMLLWFIVPNCNFKAAVMKFLLAVLGLYIKYDSESLKICPSIIIGKKTSIFDYLAIKFFTSNVDFVDVEMPHLTLPPRKCEVLQKEHINSKIKEMGTASKYLFIQPQRYICTAENAVCPLASDNLDAILQAQLVTFKLSRPIDIAVSSGTNSSYWDIVWLMFSPITTIEVCVLGTIEREPGTSNESFAELVQEKFTENGKLELLHQREEEVKELLSKESTKVIDLSTINEKSNEFYSKLSSSDRFTIREEKVKQMIQEERVKYLNRKNNQTK